MQSSTRLETFTGRDGVVGNARGTAQQRLTELRARALGPVYRVCRAVTGAASRTFVEAFGQLRSRLADARGVARRKRRMRVVEALPLGGKRQLFLVRCDEQEYLVGTGPESVETIVLRQPEAGAGPGGAAQASAGQTSPLKADQMKTRAAHAGSTRPGAMFRERPAHGPWLVTMPDTEAFEKDRVRDADSSRGLESW